MSDRVFEAMKIGINDCLPWFVVMVGIIWLADFAEGAGWPVPTFVLGLCGCGVAIYTLHVLTLRAWWKSKPNPSTLP